MDLRENQPGAPADRSASPPAKGIDERYAQAQDIQDRGYADEFPAYIRLTRDIPAGKQFNLSDDELHHMPPGNQESGWQNCLMSVEKYDRDLCQAYREQIDTLLVFAGLFSAVVTAFAIESYQWLQDDPIDTSVQLLRDVVSLLSQTSNSTAPYVPLPAQRLSGAVIVRINSFWFLSLTLSLSAALVGILCKQWLREFERNVGQSPETALAVRHIRYQGLEYWKVGSIVTSVPIIMQIALALFIIGIIELLWCLHAIVACCVTVAATLTLAFYLATTLLPVVQYVYICIRCFSTPLRTRDYHFLQAFTEPQCAFKSAQAWLSFRICWPLVNYLLKTRGYQVSSHHPPAFSQRTLRPAESWVDFDLNWVRCRETVHIGPGCAFESLTWIAANLGEMHMNAWIWHCVWARWLKSRELPDDAKKPTTDIEAVARSYPRIVSLGDNHPLIARSQAVIFQCSVRTDLPIDTALELVLRVTNASGPCSQWTLEALRLVRIVFHDHSTHISDDIAIALFHLSKLQAHAVIHPTGGPSSTTQYDAAVAFSHITVILHRRTHLRDVFIPAMAGFVLQWLRSRPPRPIVQVARGIFQGMILCLVLQGCRGAAIRDLRQYRGIMFISKLAAAVVELVPEMLHVYKPESDKHAVILELLAIFSELAQDHQDARLETPTEPVVSAYGERSTAPAPADVDALVDEETHAEPSYGLSHAAETTQPPGEAHLCIDMHVEAEADSARTDVSVEGPASPAVNPVAPASPPRSPVSPDASDPAPSG